MLLLVLALFVAPEVSTRLALSLALVVLAAATLLSFSSIYLDSIEGVVDRCCRSRARVLGG